MIKKRLQIYKIKNDIFYILVKKNKKKASFSPYKISQRADPSQN